MCALLFSLSQQSFCSQQHRRCFYFRACTPWTPLDAAPSTKQSFVKLAAFLVTQKTKQETISFPHCSSPHVRLTAAAAVRGGFGKVSGFDHLFPPTSFPFSSPSSPWTGTMCATTPPDVTWGGGRGGGGVRGGCLHPASQQTSNPPPPLTTHQAHHLPPRRQRSRLSSHLAVADPQPSHRRRQRGSHWRRDRAATRGDLSTG